MLKFDAATTALLETAYVGADVTRRRQASFDALRPAPGETIVDIGSGNGMLTAELARAVGRAGKVYGVDPSADMRAPAMDRCNEYDWVELLDGMADALPLPDASVDKAVSVQVYEYLPDLPAAVAEAARVLRPSGTFVIADMHMDSMVWHSDDPERMQRMIRSWDHHFTQRGVTPLLPPMLREAGFEITGIQPFTLCDYQLRPDGLAQMMLLLMSGFAADNGLIPIAEVEEWKAEQYALAEQGRFFFAFTQFILSARKR